MGRRARIAAALFVGLVCASCALFGPRTLHKSDVRAVVAAEQVAWNAHDYKSFFALYTPDATFIDVRRDKHGTVTRIKRTVVENWSAAAAFFATHPARFAETDTIDRIEIAKDGLSAHVFAHETAEMSARGKTEIVHAMTDQTIVLRGDRVLSLGQTDTAEE